MKMNEFDKALKEELISIANPRPFVCDGDPLKSSIFIVGFNAATEMKAKFWDFWNVESGFNKQCWFKAYIDGRASKPLKPGKMRRNKVSNTRQRIEWIIGEIKNNKCLETNLYMTATAEAKELTRSEMNIATFNFLLEAIKPELLLVHGSEAKKHMEFLTGKALESGVFNNVILNGNKVKIIPISHLSRGWSKQKCLELGKALELKLNSN